MDKIQGNGSWPNERHVNESMRAVLKMHEVQGLNVYDV